MLEHLHFKIFHIHSSRLNFGVDFLSKLRFLFFRSVFLLKFTIYVANLFILRYSL